MFYATKKQQKILPPFVNSYALSVCYAKIFIDNNRKKKTSNVSELVFN